jgi:hypothetical protein
MTNKEANGFNNSNLTDKKTWNSYTPLVISLLLPSKNPKRNDFRGRDLDGKIILKRIF